MTGSERDSNDTEAYFEANRTHWEDLVEDVSNPNTSEDIEAFLNGETGLLPLEREEMGDVAGKRLLHLQCLVGLRTLSWARDGADVTGVDFSTEAIETARRLAVETGLDDRANFVESNVYELPENHAERYDVVYTAFGVLCWLPDLDAWAEVVTEFLKPGGTFYLAEIHPLADSLSFDFDGEETRISFEHPYFTPETPVTTGASDGSGSTGTDDDPEGERPYKWTHSLGEILTALLDAGLDLTFVHEYPFAAFEQFPGMAEGEDGYWRFENDIDLPLTVTVKGTLERR